MAIGRAILVVDDHSTFRSLVASFLAEDLPDARLTLAASGGDALAQIAEAPPNVVLVDLVMPGMSGLELLARLRRELPQARLVALSGHADPELASVAIAAGADVFVPKQHLVDRLLPAILGETAPAA